jgi:hypothetical protein
MSTAFLRLALAPFLASALFLSSSLSLADQDARFPTQPDAQLTPGDVCHSPDSYRYPEHVAYCSRAVDSQTKREIIAQYDRERGYQIESMNRGDFKIDHFIPLCAGGSNERANLWPQHKSVYAITDPLEPAICQAMASGKLSQERAIEIIRQGKTHLDQVPALLHQLNSL